MTLAEVWAQQGDNSPMFNPTLAIIQAACVSEEHDEYGGCAVARYTMPDGSVIQVCCGRMEAI